MVPESVDDLPDVRRVPGRLSFVAIGVAHLGVTAWTWRDIRRRPVEQIRGGKGLWRVLSTVNTLGSVAYWLVGRRRGGSPGREPDR